MQVIDELNIEIDKRINDLILGHLSYYLEEWILLDDLVTSYRLKSNYAEIILLYTKHKRIFKKAVDFNLPNLQTKFMWFHKYDKLKEEARVILTDKGINYKEIQKNLNTYLQYTPI